MCNLKESTRKLKVFATLIAVKVSSKWTFKIGSTMMKIVEG